MPISELDEDPETSESAPIIIKSWHRSTASESMDSKQETRLLTPMEFKLYPAHKCRLIYAVLPIRILRSETSRWDLDYDCIVLLQ